MFASRKIRITLTLLVILIFAGYFVANLQKFRPLLDINVWLLAAIALGDILSVAISGLFMKVSMKTFGSHISLSESYYVSLISSVGNFFAPAGAGFGFRAIYLKKKHNFAYSHYVSTLAGNYILVFLINSLAGLLALYLLRQHANSQYFVVMAVMIAVFIFGLALSLVKIPPLKWGDNRKGLIGKILRNLHTVNEGWWRIASNRRFITQLVGLVFLSLLLTMAINRTIIASLHLSIGFAPLLLFSVLGLLSIFVNITPANLGVKEAIYLFSSTVLGFSVSQILSIALIDRGVMFIVLAIAWLAFGKRSIKSNPS